MSMNIRLIYLYNFLLYFRPQWAFLAIYCSQIAGSYTLGMAVLAVQKISSALADIPTGILSDKIGRKTTIILGSVSMILMAVCFALAHSAPMLFLGAIFNGLGESLFSGNNNALLYESLKSRNEEKQFHHYLGNTGSILQLGLGLSALLASVFVDGGLRLVFAIGIIPQILTLVVGLFLTEPDVHKSMEHNNWQHLKHTLRELYYNKRLRLLTIANSISSGAGEAHFYFIAIFIQTLWPMWALALNRAIHHALGSGGFMISGRLLDRFKAPYVLAAMRLYVFVASSVALILANVFSPLLYLTNALTFGPFTVARDQLLQQEFTDKQRATMGSIVSFSSRIVYGATIYSLGIISDHISIIAAAAFALVLGVCALPIYVTLFREHLHNPHPALGSPKF